MCGDARFAAAQEGHNSVIGYLSIWVMRHHPTPEHRSASPPLGHNVYDSHPAQNVNSSPSTHLSLPTSDRIGHYPQQQQQHMSYTSPGLPQHHSAPTPYYSAPTTSSQYQPSYASPGQPSVVQQPQNWVQNFQSVLGSMNPFRPPPPTAPQQSSSQSTGSHSTTLPARPSYPRVSSTNASPFGTAGSSYHYTPYSQYTPQPQPPPPPHVYYASQPPMFTPHDAYVELETTTPSPKPLPSKEPLVYVGSFGYERYSRAGLAFTYQHLAFKAYPRPKRAIVSTPPDNSGVYELETTAPTPRSPTQPPVFVGSPGYEKYNRTEIHEFMYRKRTST
jgi:hypothetical protein